MVFWIVTAVLALLLASVLVRALLQGRETGGPAAAFDLQVYRDQLKEVDSEAERGKISPDEAERLRTEISRRILAADSKAQEAQSKPAQPRMTSLVTAGVLALFVVGGGFGLYQGIGAPGFPDLPLQARLDAAEEARANRPSQATAESQLPPSVPPADAPERLLTLIAKLRETVAERPDDLRGHELLAQYEAALGNHNASYQALAQIIKIRGPEADAENFVDLADMMIIAAGGYVSPEAQQILEQALARDPQNGVARFYGGLMMAQTGRPDVGFRMWDRLLRESPADAPWLPPIQAQIEEMAFRAGITSYQMPTPRAPALPGPDADAVAAASDMTVEERMDMIKGMVEGLSERLATEGGPPAEWARLISSLAVLGDTEQATAILAEARTVFAEDASALSMLDQAAQRAGLGE